LIEVQAYFAPVASSPIGPLWQLNARRAAIFDEDGTKNKGGALGRRLCSVPYARQSSVRGEAG
jgi:hypothetical protein